MDDDDLNLALELAEEKHRAMQRSKVLLEPCPHCGAFPKIEARDLYGYPRAVGLTHLPTCIEYGAD